MRGVGRHTAHNAEETDGTVLPHPILELVDLDNSAGSLSNDEHAALTAFATEEFGKKLGTLDKVMDVRAVDGGRFFVLDYPSLRLAKEGVRQVRGYGIRETGLVDQELPSLLGTYHLCRIQPHTYEEVREPYLLE